MEITNIEVRALEATNLEAQEHQAQELDDLQLALVGGGNVIIFVG